MPASRLRPPSRRLAGPLRRVALGLALAFGWVAGAQAQSLLELYEAARAYDATYLSAKALADSQQYVLEQRRALMRPSASLSANAGRTITDPARDANTFTTGSNGLSISGSQPLFNRANSIQVEQAEKAYQISRQDLEAAEQDLIVRVSQAYFDVLAAQDVLATAGANKTAISEQLASAKRNFEVGTATITDTREAQARHDLALATELAAENDLRNKRIFLEQLVGRPGVQPRPLVTPAVLPALPSPSVDDWVSRADQQHPTVRRAQLAYETAQLETERARAARLPTIAATAQAGADQSRPGPANRQSATVGLQLSMPLFTGFSVQNRIKETLVLEQKAREDLEAARRAVATATRQTFYGVQSGLAQVKAFEAAESSSQLALEATQLGYKVGVRVNLDVLNAQTQLFTARRDLAKARYDVLLNNLKLRQASGQLNPVDVANINTLFAK